MEELQEREPSLIRYDGCREQLTQVLVLLGNPARIESKEHGVQDCGIDARFLSAGVRIVGDIFGRDDTAINVDGQATRILQVLDGSPNAAGQSESPAT